MHSFSMYIYAMDANLYKGSLETIVLKLLSEQGEMYGYEITKRVKELSDGEIIIKEGSLYPLLHRMEAKGIIRAETKPFGNRMRKYYHLTEKGRKDTLSIMKEMEKYLGIMQHILHPKTT